MRSDRSVVNMVGALALGLIVRVRNVPAPAPPLATHCCAPAGLFVSSHSKPNRFSKKLLLHWVGVGSR